MKIAHVVLKALPFGGGIEKYVEEIGPRLAAKGHEIVVYTMRHYGTPPGSYKGMRIVPIPALPSKFAEKITSSLLATLHACFKEKPDLIHFHSFTQQTTFLPKWMGIPALVQGHGLEWKRSRWNAAGKWILKLSEWLMVSSTDNLTAVSRVQQDYLRKTYGKECCYIPTGVNPPNRLEPKEITQLWGLKGRDYFLTAVRLVPEKGIHTLIEAYRGLSLPAKLVIAGDAGHEKAYFRRLKALAGDDPRIVFTGYVSGSPYAELMSNAYAFILASDLEGLPTALLEAMSYGNCCLASDIPENLEALGGRGLTFKTGSAEDLRWRLLDLWNNPEKTRYYRSMAPQDMMPSFHWDRIADQFHGLYARIAATGGDA
ncbi:MAG TPA: glycosyltransferase family 4 protein [bacterium]|nr:glycosyltransferase family 4 protein [bacterium]